MKKLLILPLLAIAFLCSAQYPQKQTIGNSATLVEAPGAIRSKFVNQFFVDTTAANMTEIRRYSGAQIYTTFGNGFWIRNSTATAWIRLTTGLACSGLQAGTGIVSYSGTGLAFNVSAANYCIANTPYSTTAASLTLGAAHAALPRLDVIAVTTSQTVVVIPGVPNATPAIPQIDPSSQVYLTSILVPANSLTPGGITSTNVYAENVEWTSTSALTAGTVDFNSTSNPYNGTKNALLSSTAAGTIYWQDATTHSLSEYSNLTFYVRIDASAPSADFGINLLSGSSTVTTSSLSAAAYGFSGSTVGSYQLITVPMSAFPTTSLFDGIGLKFTAAGAAIHIDYVRLQTGTGGSSASPALWAAYSANIANQNTGNVGIGTSTPSAKLDVVGNIKAHVLYLQDSSLNGEIGSAGGTIAIYEDATNKFKYGNEELVVDGSNVGIGTASPDSVLHVFGGVKIVNGTQGSGKVLTSDANGGASWQTPTAGTVTSVASGYGVLGGPITSTGTLSADTASATGLVSKSRLANSIAAIPANTLAAVLAAGNWTNTHDLKLGGTNSSNSLANMSYGNFGGGNEGSFTAYRTGYNLVGQLRSDRLAFSNQYSPGNITFTDLLPPQVNNGFLTGISDTLPNASGVLAITATIGGTPIRTDSAGNLALPAYPTGTVSSVAALTLGTSGTDLSSSVATGTTTPVITLNVPTASASNRGALSSTDWSTFNNKLSTATAASIYQPLDTDLTTIAGLTATTDNTLMAVGSAWASRTPAQVKTTLSLNNVDNTSDATKNAASAILTNKTATNLQLTAGTTSVPPLQFNAGSPTTIPVSGNLMFNNGLWIADSSASVRDTFATRDWVRDNAGSGGGGITALTGDVTASGSGSVAATIAAGVIVDADVNAAAAIDLKKLATNYAVAGGSGTAFTLTLSPAPTAYYTGMQIRFTVPSGNTGATTINVNGLGAIAVRKYGTNALASFDLNTNRVYEAVYDGTVFQLLTTAGLGASGTGGVLHQTSPQLVGPVLGVATGTSLALTGNMSASGGYTGGYVAKTGAYSITTSDYVIDVTSGTHTQTLPTAVGVTGRIYTVKNSGAGSITVGTTSPQTIDGSTTYTLATQYKYVTVMSNGANWIVTANN